MGGAALAQRLEPQIVEHAEASGAGGIQYESRNSESGEQGRVHEEEPADRHQNPWQGCDAAVDPALERHR